MMTLAGQQMMPVLFSSSWIGCTSAPMLSLNGQNWRAESAFFLLSFVSVSKLGFLFSVMALSVEKIQKVLGFQWIFLYCFQFTFNLMKNSKEKKFDTKFSNLDKKRNFLYFKLNYCLFYKSFIPVKITFFLINENWIFFFF